MNKLVARARLAMLWLFVFTWSSLAFSQGIVTGSISGVVTDQQQAVIVGAKVTALEVATNREFSTVTNSSGSYRISQLPVGSYTVTIQAPNFGKLESKNVVVAVAKETDLGTQVLKPGAETTIVEVEGGAPIVESTTAQISSSFDPLKLKAIPLAGGLDVVALYVPGVIQQAGASFGNTNGAGIGANGQRSRSNNFQIDGQTNNDQSVTGPGLFISNPDVIAEYQVLTSNYSSEYGRNTGAQINYVTKAGSNAFHGSLFEYYIGNWSFSRRNQDKNPLQGFCAATSPAPGCRPSVVPRSVDNRFGGTFGGPIVRDRLWFFGAYMENKIRSGGSPSTSSVATPTPAGITALVAAFPNSRGVRALQAFGPYAITAGNPIPSGTVSNRTVSDGVTTVSVPFANITRFLTGTYDEREWLVRGDWQISSKDRFFTRFIRETSMNALITGNAQNGQVVDVPAESYGIGFDYSRTWTTRLVQQVRFSKTRNRFAFEGGTVPTCTVANINACSPSIGFTSGTDLGFGMQNNLPQDRNVNNYQFQSNVSWALASHTLKFGGEYAWQFSPSTFLPNVNGTFTYASFDALVRNQATTLSLADGPLAFDFEQRDVSFYFQDDWRVTPNFTLNMGVRWEWNEQAVNLLHDITVANQAQSPPFWSTTAPSRVTLFPKIPEDYNNFSPNFGFAWTPQIMPALFGEGKTVIRGGYRLAFDVPFYNIFLNSATAAPVVNLGTITTGATLPATDFTGTGVRAANLALIPRGANPGLRSQTRVAEDLHNPYTHQWSLGIQRQISSKMGFEVRYVGNKTVGQYQTINANPIISTIPVALRPSGVTPCANATAPGFNRLDCDFSLVRTRVNGASANYNGLQSRVDISNWHGLVLGASYTWSKAMDNTSEIFASGGGANSVISQNPFDRKDAEYAESAASFPHVANIYWGYELPWFKNQSGFVGRVFGGWNFSGGWRYQSGEPFNPIQLVANSACDTTWNNGFIGRDSCRPLLGSASAPIDSVGRYETGGLVNNSTCVGTIGGATCPFINVSSVRWIINNNNATTAGHSPFAGVGRNFMRGQNRNNVDLSLRKSTKITERVNIQLGIDVFNAFNYMYLGVPGNVVNNRNINGLNPTTGAASPSNFMNTAFNTSGRRSAQLMAKIVF